MPTGCPPIQSSSDNSKHARTHVRKTNQTTTPNAKDTATNNLCPPFQCLVFVSVIKHPVSNQSTQSLLPNKSFRRS